MISVSGEMMMMASVELDNSIVGDAGGLENWSIDILLVIDEEDGLRIVSEGVAVEVIGLSLKFTQAQEIGRLMVGCTGSAWVTAKGTWNQHVLFQTHWTTPSRLT